ncbi:translation initiation factor IF-2-like isoform X6 [Prionailurus iriomotensis]
MCWYEQLKASECKKERHSEMEREQGQLEIVQSALQNEK